MRAMCGAALAIALGLVAGCSAGSAGSAAQPARTVATSDPGQPAGPSATIGDVRLEVTGFHVFPLPAGDTGAASAAAAFGLPVAEVAQMHLLLTVRNTGTADHRLTADAVRLALGAVTVDPATTDTFPPGALHPGEQTETAVGFDLAIKGGSGAATLLWTHDGTSTVIPIGGARQAG